MFTPLIYVRVKAVSKRELVTRCPGPVVSGTITSARFGAEFIQSGDKWTDTARHTLRLFALMWQRPLLRQP